MLNSLEDLKIILLPCDYAENGDLTVMEGLTHLPFAIARVFVVRGFSGVIRGNHAHKKCTQFLTCPFGSVEVLCDDGHEVREFTLDRPEKGLLIPPGIWARQKYIVDNSVLTVVCDMPYDSLDYIRSYENYLEYKKIIFDGKRNG